MGSENGASEETLELRSARGVVPLGYARGEDAVYLVARARSAQWPVDVLRSGRAELFLDRQVTVGTPELVTDPEAQRRILGLFREKYGRERYARWYDQPARVLRIRLDGGARNVGPGSSAYYDWLESEFDNVADDYDRHITGNRVNRLLRDRSLAVLRRTLAGARRVLEIGCGSGMETLPLLEQGHEVLAVDISERMLSTVRRKAERAGVAHRLETRAMAARDLGHLVDEGHVASFDGAFSTYGALNCEPDLRPIPSALSRLLKPGAPFVAGVYNRWCLFELVGYSLTFQPRRALGRRKNPVPVGASRFCVDVYAHSPDEFVRLFSPDFAPASLEAVLTLLPPSDLVGYAERFSRHFDVLSSWDARLGRQWPFRGLGDHFLMTFVRQG